MKAARDYIAEFDPAFERLEALVTRVQDDAYAAGSRDAAGQLFEIAEQTSKRVSTVIEHNTISVPK